LLTGEGDRGGYYRPLSLIEVEDGQRVLLFETLSGMVLYRLDPDGPVEVRAILSRLAHGC